MVMLTTGERLAKIRRQIEELAANGQNGAAETAARRRCQLDELRRQERAAQAAVRRAEEGSTEFEQFQARLRVAESTVAADVAETREAFTEAVEDELHNWDNYLERLQAQAVLRAASAREQVEAAISDLRRRRNDVAVRLADVRTAADGAWDEQRKRLTAARDDLQREADELSERFR